MSIFNQLLVEDPSIVTRQFDRVGTSPTAICSHQAPIKSLKYLFDLGADQNQDPNVMGYPLALVVGQYPDGTDAAMGLLLWDGPRLKHLGVLGCAARLRKKITVRFLLSEGATPDIKGR